MSGQDARNDPSALEVLAGTDAFEELARSCGMSKEDFLREWNKGAAWADKHWADNPGERSVGRTYREVITGNYQNSTKPFIEQEEI